MKNIYLTLYIFSICLLISACNSADNEQTVNSEMQSNNHTDEHHHNKPDLHAGHLLHKDGFSIQLKIIETGLASEMRAWIKNNGKNIDPKNVILHVWLQRLGAEKQLIHFYPNNDYLRGDIIIHEPHSFEIVVEAEYQNNTYRWNFASFEGRTTIPADLAKLLNIESSIAGPATIHETVNVYGQIIANPENFRNIVARFDGVIRNVNTSIGSFVKKGKTLATVESNESLNTYSIKAPINGVVTQRYANSGEQTNGRLLFTIVDISNVWANLSVFPKDRDRIKLGNEVHVSTIINDKKYSGKINNINQNTESNQAIVVRVSLNNSEGKLLPGDYVSAEITVRKHDVPLAVKNSAIQQNNDSSVLYIQANNQYEARQLQLGKKDNQWVEVLSGIKAGTKYVSRNSYIVRADIDKASVSHDH